MTDQILQGMVLGVLIGMFLGIIEMLFLTKHFPHVLNQHVWFEFNPEYVHDIVTLFKNFKHFEVIELPPYLDYNKSGPEHKPVVARGIITLGAWFDFKLSSARRYLESVVLDKLNKADIKVLDSGVY
jgi:hypothetical protein